MGLPGDNLNLYAVLDLFQQCATFEEFEKKLNQEDSKINNLDLNNDGKTDYIKVIDNKNGDNHAVVLQIPINEKENQDVAVIEIEKSKDDNYLVQIVGNEDLYGKDYIVEPKENDSNQKQVSETPIPKSNQADVSSNDGKTVIVNNNTTNNNYSSAPDTRVYVTVRHWPIIRHVYSPVYVVYVSPWYWHYYPVWWNPWKPWYWHNYYWHHHHYHNHYHGHYHRTPIYRSPNTHTYYGQRKSSSPMVMQNRTKGSYVKTYDSPNKGKPMTTNPAFKPSKAEAKPLNSNIKTEGKPNYNKSEPKSDSKPVMKPVDNSPKSKPNKVKPQSKPNSPNVKPQQRPSNTKPPQQNKGPRKK